VTELEVQYVADAAANDWYRDAGKSVGRFEREFADYLGLAHAAAVPHGTSALHLAMLALDLRPGDEVIVPESTWVATAAPLAYLGAVPVFADVDPRTWGIAAESLERCLSEDGTDLRESAHPPKPQLRVATTSRYSDSTRVSVGPAVLCSVQSRTRSWKYAR